VKQVRVAGATSGRELARYEERVTLFERSELEEFLSSAGLEPVEALGDYAGGAFDAAQSPRLILLARKDPAMTTGASATPLRVAAERPLTRGRGFLALDPGALAARAPGVLDRYRARRPLAAAGEASFLEAVSLRAPAPPRRRTRGVSSGARRSRSPPASSPATAAGLPPAPQDRDLHRARAPPVRGGLSRGAGVLERDRRHGFRRGGAGAGGRPDPRGRPARARPGTAHPGLVVGAIPLEASRPRLAEWAGAEHGLEFVDGLWDAAAAAASDMGTLSGSSSRGSSPGRAWWWWTRGRPRSARARGRSSSATRRRTRRSRARLRRARGRSSPRAGSACWTTGPLAWCLFRRDGETRLRMEERDRVEEARRLLAEDPPALSPNVVLRPVAEDHLFPHVARVVGPAEMRYHDELAPAYPLLGVERAQPVARLAMTRLPREAVWLAGAAGGRRGSSGRPTTAWCAARRRDSRPRRSRGGRSPRSAPTGNGASPRCATGSREAGAR